MVTSAQSQETDLRIHAEEVASTLLREEEAYVADKDAKLDQLLSAYSGLEDCDEALEKVEKSLLSFQVDLTKVSGEIRHINDTSTALGIKLENRTDLETSLHKVLARILLEPETIKVLTGSDVNDAYLKALAALDKQASFCRRPQAKSLASYPEVVVEMDRLVLSACGRIRSFFLEIIGGFRAKNTNVHIIQNSVLLHFQPAHAFLHKWHVEAGREVEQEFMHTMRWFYDEHFDRYHRGLSRYQAPMLSKTDLMCGEVDQVKSSFFGGSSSSSSTSPSPEAFTLTNRMKPLINHPQEEDVIILHVAERNHQTFTFERLFRSFHVALMDNVCSEYQFIE
ncbi:hypothetical protein BJ684DRAFT_19709, partial [Piptocephalis cylindrospora]